MARAVVPNEVGFAYLRILVMLHSVDERADVLETATADFVANGPGTSVEEVDMLSPEGNPVLEYLHLSKFGSPFQTWNTLKQSYIIYQSVLIKNDSEWDVIIKRIRIF